MEKIFEILFNWHLIMFCLSISAITFVVKKFANFGVNKVTFLKKFHDFWFEVLTPTIPVLIGGLMSYFMTSYPYPPEVNGTSGRLFFGFVAGMFSGLVYKVIKSFIVKKAMLNTNDDSSSSAPNNPASNSSDKPSDDSSDNLNENNNSDSLDSEKS